MTTPAPDLVPCPAELATVAATTRPDHDFDDWHSAILAATSVWAWPRVLAEVGRLLARGETPHDLRAACAGLTFAHRNLPEENS